MTKLAILGFGTVGSGVYEILKRNKESIARRLGESLEVGYICDIRDFSGHEAANLFVKDLDTVLADADVKVVVETIGGLKPAYEFVQKALDAGRHVVTSNKEMVAAYGAELLAKAKQNGVCFLFEASVGGGTPIITPIHQCLAANNISSVAGIINGTTNFMLMRMEKGGLEFDTALKEAQDLGYAETIDPSSDVDGIDAGRKIAILASLCYGHHIYPENVKTRGIRKVSPVDMAVAGRLGCAVKLIAWAQKPEGGALSITVEPMLVDRGNQLAGVDDVFNAVQVEGDMLGEVLFYGKGAGKLPTASAVVADAIDALKEGVRIHDSLFWEPAAPIEGLYPTGGLSNWYIRPAAGTLPGARALEGGGLLLEGLTDDEVTAALAAAASQPGQDAKGFEAANVMRIWR